MSLNSDIKNMVESIGLNIYDIVVTNEGEETIFRISVSHPDGVSMEKCVEATHLISPLLDVTPPVSGEYRLEVSSPGIERPLKTLEHFSNSVGEKAALVLEDKTKLRGPIEKVEGKSIFIDVDGDVQSVEFNEIVKAKTYFEW